MAISVTSKRKDATLEIKTKDGQIHYIPPRSRKLVVHINESDIILASDGLIIVCID